MSPEGDGNPGETEGVLGWLRRNRWLVAGVGGVVAASAALIDYALLRPLLVVSQATNVRLAMVGIRSRYITVDGNRIHYFEGGSASTAGRPPVVLIHGLGSTAERWASLMMQVALDQKQKQDQKQGQNESGRVRRLVLFNSAGLRYHLGWDPDLFVPDTPAKLSALDQLVFPNSPKLPGFVKTDLFRQARREGWIIRRSLESMLKGLDVEDGKLGELKMPVLIVWGRQDRIVPLSVGERMHAAMPQSVLDIYDGCGHLGPVQFAGRIGPRVIAFLNADPPEAPGVNNF